jgi:integrase
MKSIWQACSRVAAAIANTAQTSAGGESPQAIPRPFATIVQLLMLTGQRRGEIAALRSSWIKDNTITLPKEMTKNGREHACPLGELAQGLLRETARSHSPSPTKFSSNHTLLLFPARGVSGNPFNGWSKSKAVFDKVSGVTDWTLHDLRRTFATRLAELGVAPHIIERLLNHVSGTISGITAVYNRARYEKECRDAIQLWEAHLTKLFADRTAT